MREQGSVNLLGQESAIGGAGGDGTVNEQCQEYLTVASKGRDVRKTTFLLAALFGLGLLGLLFMIKKSSPQGAAAADTSGAESVIETAIEGLTGIESGLFARLDNVVQRFYEYSDVRQVQVSELVRNPFKHDAAWGTLSKVPDSDRSNAEAERLLRAQQLKLLSIMHSKQGSCCMIDDKILYEGDLIKDFKIGKIEQDCVTLRSCQTASEDMEIVLKLSE
jgi:hypothetical protein